MLDFGYGKWFYSAKDYRANEHKRCRKISVNGRIP